MAKRNSDSEDRAATGNGRKLRRSRTAAAGYFLELKVQNVRCFSDEQTLSLADAAGRPAQWTLLLGNNGTGKTTLLQGLAAAHRRWWRGGGWSLFRSADKPARVSLRHCLAKGLQSRNRLTEIRDSWVEYRSPSVTVYSTHGTADLKCLAYGANRRLGESTVGDAEPDDPCASLFSDSAELKNAEEWLLRLDYSASKPSEIETRQRKRLEQVKDILCDLLPDIAKIRITKPTKQTPTPAAEFHTPYGWVPLRSLGQGYQSLIAWVVDFASRMVDRYPNSRNPLAQPAIVLIDEIDLHLHPTWQRRVMGYLSERFPNTQFIASAHSPLIVQAAGDANVALLRREGDHVVIDNDVKAIRGWRIDQILTSDLYELPTARPPDVEEKLGRRKALLTKGRLTKKEKQELSRLNAEVHGLPVGDTAAEVEKLQDLMRQTRALLEKYED